MLVKARQRLARPGVENVADQGENEKNWLRKARSVISGVLGGVIPRLTCYSGAGRSKGARVDAHSCIKAVTEDEKEVDLERTGLDLGELMYGTGRGGTRCLEDRSRSFAYGKESVLPMPLSMKDVRGENGETCREKTSPYGQMVLSKQHQRAILRLSTIFKKNPSMKLLDVRVRKSNGNSGAEKRCTGGIPRFSVRARAVAWVLVKLQHAQQKMKVKTVSNKLSNPIKEEEPDNDDDQVILTNAEEEGGEVELCKKRILMGRRCKPLNCSGTLQYDSNGILLPELLP